jgi:2'-5' RNA ligase
MAGFLIEFRLQGYAKKYARWARTRVHREARRRGVRELRQPRFVPHITLFGQAETNNLQNVIREVERIGRKYTLVPLKLGVKRGKFQKLDANWLYLDVQPSPDLEQFRHELAQSLLSLEGTITCKPHDRKSKYKFHTSIGKYDPRDRDKFEGLFDYAETKCSLEIFKQCKASVFGRLFNIIKKYVFRVQENDPGINLHLLRVTILGRKSRIQREYDLVLKKLLSRREALSRYWWRKTIEQLKIELAQSREKRLPPKDSLL